MIRNPGSANHVLIAAWLIQLLWLISYVLLLLVSFTLVFVLFSATQIDWLTLRHGAQRINKVVTTYFP